MTYKIAFFDIDGTLADNRRFDKIRNTVSRIPDSARQAIRDLKVAGIEPVLATGRNWEMIEDILEYLEIDSAVCCNGQYVVHHDQVLFEQNLTHDQLVKITDALYAQGLPFGYETATEIVFHERITEGVKTMPDITYRPIENDTIPDHIIQVNTHVPTSDFKLELNVEGVKAVKVAPIAYDIFDNHFSKAVGIHHMLEEMGLTADQAIAFGDEENDIEMFHQVGMAIAMGNANPKLKDIANYVTKPVWEDGILHAVEHLNLT